MNKGFGQRIRELREKRGMDRKLLTQLAMFSRQQVKMIEAGQLDHLDFNRAQLGQLASVLQCSVADLTGMEPADCHPEEVLAQRTSIGASPVQLLIDLSGDECPRCHTRGRGSRCDKCGFALGD